MTMHKRKIELWFKKFPKHIADKAIHNRTRQLMLGNMGGYASAGQKRSSLLSALFTGFSWANTKEGYNYWYVIHANLHWLDSLSSVKPCHMYDLTNVDSEWEGIKYTLKENTSSLAYAC